MAHSKRSNVTMNIADAMKFVLADDSEDSQVYDDSTDDGRDDHGDISSFPQNTAENIDAGLGDDDNMAVFEQGDTRNAHDNSSSSCHNFPAENIDDSSTDAEEGGVGTDVSTVAYDASIRSLDSSINSNPRSPLAETRNTNVRIPGLHDDSVIDNTTDDEAQLATIKRRKTPQPDLWQKAVLKKARLEGKKYTTANKTVESRTMGPPCTSSFCQSSSSRHCSTFDEAMRTTIFTKFWNMGTWDERRTYVQALARNVPKKQSKCEDSGREVFTWHLTDSEGKQQQVCRGMFAATLGINEKTLSNWVRAPHTSRVPPEEECTSPAPKTGPSSPLKLVDKRFLDDWLDSIPTVPSHYCRGQKSYETMKFIFNNKTITNLHQDYTKACRESGVRAAGWKYFLKQFHDHNLSFFIPRKDQCDLCVGFKQGNVSKEEYDAHVTKKTAAQEMKSLDKEEAMNNEETSVWTMDLQSVLMCPRTQASALYYRTKLTVHNMTYYNLSTREGYCYVFDETNGDLSSKMFGFLHTKHFRKYVEEHPTIKKLVIWSDGCGYQNKSTAVANSFLQFAIEKNVTVEQKYLVSGHTQMECDSIHSVIERKLKCDIFTPQDYMTAMKMARQAPFPYEVREVIYSDVFAISGEYIKSIRPGKKAGDPTVSDVCAYKYSLSHGVPQILYKLEWGDDWSQLPARTATEPKTWMPLFQNRLPITDRKFQDLQAMKSVMPRCVHHFFDTLPKM